MYIFSSVASAVRGLTLDPQEDTIDVEYDLEVVCDIEPSSTADNCEVIVSNAATTVSGNVLQCTVFMGCFFCSLGK